MPQSSAEECRLTIGSVAVILKPRAARLILALASMQDDIEEMTNSSLEIHIGSGQGEITRRDKVLRVKWDAALGQQVDLRKNP